jgi:hypothetical protein
MYHPGCNFANALGSVPHTSTAGARLGHCVRENAQWRSAEVARPPYVTRICAWASVVRDMLILSAAIAYYY